MKNTFFILAFALSVSAYADNSCIDPIGLSLRLSEMVQDLMKDPCKDKLNSVEESSKVNSDYCSCLLKSKGALFADSKTKKISDNPLLKEEIEKAAVKRKKRLDNLYRYLNFEVSLQEQKYDLTDKNKQVGCTPKAMANTMNTALCQDESSCTLGKAAGEATAVIGQKANYAMMPWNKKDSSGIDLTVNSETNKRKKLEGALGFLKKLTDAEIKKVIDAVGTKGYSEEEIQRIEIIKKSQKSNQAKLTEIDSVVRDANERIIVQNSMSGTSLSLQPTPYEIAFRNTFKEADARINQQFKEDHKQSVPKSCINYDVFKAIDGLPTEAMMKDWATAGEDGILKSLEPGNLKKDPVMKNFLRRNPVIAKNMISRNQREKLAKALSGFASQNKGANKVSTAERFTDFMKTTIKQLNTENEVGSLLQCDLLAQNYAAASDPHMSLALLTNSDNQISQLANNVQVCQIQEDNQSNIMTPIPSLDEIVNANELFAIFDSEADGDIYSPKNDKAYLDYLDKKCDKKTMERIEKKHTSGVFRCTWISRRKCDEKALDTESGKREKILEEYYKEDPELGSLVHAIQKNTKKLDLDDVANKTNENNQNQEIRSQYDKYVKPIISQRSMYEVSNAMGAPTHSSSSSNGSSSSSIADAVNKAQESYTETHSSSQIAESGHVSETSFASASSGEATASAPQTSSSAIANPGQYIPPFLDNKPTTSPKSAQKISSVDEARDALEDMMDAPDEEKADYAERAKEYLNSQDQTSKEIADLQKKLDDYEQKNIPAQAVAKDNTRVAARAPASVSMNVPTATNRTTGFANASINNAASPSSSSFAKLSAGSTVSKAAASYANALNQANESRADAKSLSLVVESGASFDFNNSPISGKAGELVIGTSLEPSDKLYAEISSDPEAMKTYLAQNLKEIPVDKVVSIKCKGAGCNASAGEILLVITKGSDNKFSIRSVSRDTKVARSHRIQDLQNEFKKAVR